MKPNSSPPGAMPRYLAASLLLSLLPVTGQTLVNGNFDAQAPFTLSNGYANGNGGVITGWTISDSSRVGLNQAGQAFAGAAGSATGVIPSSPNVCFLQAATGITPSISQSVTGLTIGTKYTVSVRFSARFNGSSQRPSLVFSTNGNGPTVKLEVETAGASTAYRTAAFQFIATGTSNTITFTNDRTTGDNTLVLDNVTVTAAATTSTWSFAPWTDDTVPGSGIDPSCVYTHAVRFGNNAPATINSVNFIGRETGTTGRFALVGYGSIFNNVGHAGVTGNSATLANDFRYSATPSITLQNLKPLTQYVFTAYGVGFDAATTYYRAATFGSSVPGSDNFSVNLNHYGQGQGIRVNYTYTTDASGTPVVISLPASSPTLAGAWHTSGFSNREVTPRTQATLWTTQAWNDDATSGISPNHVYTHAFKFGDPLATNYYVNGVKFTGITGANPSGTNYTSTNPGVITNHVLDPNNVTGYGAAIAHNFLNGGFPQVHNLSGLTIGKNYIFTIYSTGWDATGTRVGAFIGDVGEQMTLLNQDQYGENNGIRFEYAYTATATTAKITVGGYDGTNSIHTYAVSNREADAMVGVAPQFTLQPTGATIGAGTNYTLRGGTIGSATMTYQWKKGSNPISGATDPVLVLNSVTASDSAAYTLEVTNGSGTTTSNVANVAVLENIPGYANTGLGVDGQGLANGQVDTHFKLIVNPDNNNASDTVYVQSNIPGSWLANSATSKWIGPRINTANAAGTLNAVGNPSDAGAGDGTYVYRTSLDLTGFDLSTVVISGKWGSDNSGVKIRVNGTDVGFPNTVGVTFQILVPFSISNSTFPGLLTTGVNTIDFYVTNTDTTSAGGFTGLRIQDFAAVGAIPPGTPPHIGVQPVGVDAKHNSYVTLAVGASGSAPLSYEWSKNGSPIVPAETNPVLSVLVGSPASAGSYTVRVTGSAAPFADSNPAIITINNANPTTAIDDVGSTNENVARNIDVTTLLGNDSDSDGDLVVFTSVSPTSAHGGTVTESAGVITYTPAHGYDGQDTFTYTVNDGVWGGSTTETVVITVNNVVIPPPSQMTLVLSGGTATGTFTGTPGETYVLQRSTTLEAGSWVPIDTQVAAPVTGAVSVTDPSPPPGKAFYRISYPQ